MLRTYVLCLRKVLGDNCGEPLFIQTLPKRGYRFLRMVSERSSRDHGREATPASETDFSSGLVGRETEIARLQNHMSLQATGQRQVVFVSGEDGIGKTALLDAFLQQASRPGEANVARGQCVQGIGASEDFYPIVDALSKLAASPDGENARRILAGLAPAWLPPGCAPDPASPLTDRPRTMERTVGDLCAALEELAAERPLILVFEDLDWSDEPTLNLISALARRRIPAKLMVLVTFMPRKSATHPRLKELLQDLLVRHLCAEIALAPLQVRAYPVPGEHEVEAESTASRVG